MCGLDTFWAARARREEEEEEGEVAAKGAKHAKGEEEEGDFLGGRSGEGFEVVDAFVGVGDAVGGGHFGKESSDIAVDLAGEQ